MRVAYRAVRSRRKFVKTPEVRKFMENWMEQEAKPHFIGRFDLVVANWKNKVTFKARKFLRADSLRLVVFPDKHKDIWKYVTEGTKPHPIPGKGKILSFVWGGPGSYKPKTAPKARFGGPGTVVGGERVFFARIKRHPGTKPRPFPEEIARDEKPWFSRNAENAWRRAWRLV